MLNNQNWLNLDSNVAHWNHIDMKKLKYMTAHTRLPNKLFKSDSQRVAFLLCVEFSV
ncbi:hypothetical protein D020_4891 [Vibrio parahaemolyticus SBR10290]|nr:hypothetical protein D052_3312 [Vibrio parahaemolyticus 10290]ESV65966.1 hypothetical protein D021_4931 [Vibrio parahaemolyticus 10296]ESW41748.1 hypothetical protein D022_4811 [Vibrio parahaemolyticus 12310]ETT15305.1 hypothetical protein D023_4739 [Vibrio parahaemolyticus 3256]ETX50252.1 hypothetical protein D020_4891 [Vibrio parahaemolyticus SBR10290]